LVLRFLVMIYFFFFFLLTCTHFHGFIYESRFFFT
jgi:hypothetical protein